MKTAEYSFEGTFAGEATWGDMKRFAQNLIRKEKSWFCQKGIAGKPFRLTIKIEEIKK